MTLCIAAIAQDPNRGASVVTCFDKRGETDFTSAEIEMKFRYLGGRWFALFAGDIFQANELLNLYRDFLRDKEFREYELVDELGKPPALLRKKLVERYVQSRFSLSYDQFLLKGSRFPRAIYREASEEIRGLQLDCELIVFGYVENKVVLFVVESNGSVGTDAWLPFAAIGSGAQLASAWLYFREQQQGMFVERTMYHVYEAKKFGDRAPGVGERTELAVVSIGELRYMTTPPMDDSLMKELDCLWVKFGPQRTEAVQPNSSLLRISSGYPPKPLLEAR